MSLTLFNSRLLFRGDVGDAALTLAHKLSRHEPRSVVFLETGGAFVGRAIAEALKVTARGIDIRYPLSRIDSLPFYLVAFPVKEIAYRLTKPTLAPTEQGPRTEEPIALVDDCASSGRSIVLAKEALVSAGADPRSIVTAVVRCGGRARDLVDYYLYDEKVVFAYRRGKTGLNPR